MIPGLDNDFLSHTKILANHVSDKGLSSQEITTLIQHTIKSNRQNDMGCHIQRKNMTVSLEFRYIYPSQKKTTNRSNTE